MGIVVRAIVIAILTSVAVLLVRIPVDAAVSAVVTAELAARDADLFASALVVLLAHVFCSFD